MKFPFLAGNCPVNVSNNGFEFHQKKIGNG